MSVKFRDFVMYVISSLVFKLGNFANFKALFSVVLMDFPYLSMKKKLKNIVEWPIYGSSNTILCR